MYLCILYLVHISLMHASRSEDEDFWRVVRGVVLSRARNLAFGGSFFADEVVLFITK